MFPRFSNKKGPQTIGRSESFRQTRESKPSFRKRSDPNIPRSKSDVEVDDKRNSHLNESRSSSNSSLSNRSLDSPCHSSEMVHRTNTTVSADSVPANFAPGSGTGTGTHMAGSGLSTDDSDLEADADPPKWQENVDWDLLKVMKPKEKKRQDVINELFHTERTHVRNLKVLDRLFYKPMLQEQLLPGDFLTLLFPNLEEMLDIHTTFNNKLKARRKTEPVIGDIGQLMLEMFDGEAGLHLKHAAATYCENQSIALESLKARQKKDQKLAQSLSDAEANNLCRRLQLKDIIASGFQRLTKYPLLLENIAKYTPPNTSELADLQRAVECSKEILVHVDAAIKEAENLHRLLDVQRRMDRQAFDKIDHPIVHAFKNLDVTKHKLLHEGSLHWRLSKQKSVDVHVLLTEEILILLQKVDEKFVLKFHNTVLTSGREDTKVVHSPILRTQNLFTRENATDKRTFFIISSSEMHAMYEFVASSQSEKKQWCTQVDRTAQEQKQKNLAKETPQQTPDSMPNEDHVDKDESAIKDSESSTDNSKSLPVSPDTNGGMPVPEPPIPDSPTPDESPQKAKVIEGDDDTRRSHGRLERVEILEIMEGPHLIEPSEVIVISGAICETAEPVLTPFEKLRRKDLEIARAMEEKELITAEILNISVEDLRNSQAPDDTKDSSALEVATVAVQTGNQLASLINDGLSLEDLSSISETSDTTEESSNVGSVSLNSFCRLKGISLQSILPLTNSLSHSLAQLLVMVQESENERHQLRSELIRCQEQIHQLNELHRHCPVQSSQSRPSSFISVASSTTSDGGAIIGDFFETQQLCSVLEKSEDPPSIEDTSDPPPTDLQSPSSPVITDNQSESLPEPSPAEKDELRTLSDLPPPPNGNTSDCDASKTTDDQDNAVVMSSSVEKGLTDSVEKSLTDSVVEEGLNQ